MTNDDSTTIELTVSNDEVALEVAYGILGRAQRIHENPHDEFEETALELRDVGNGLREKFE